MKCAIVPASVLRDCKQGWLAEYIANACIGCDQMFDDQGRPCKFGMSRENIVKRIQWHRERLWELKREYARKQEKILKELEIEINRLHDVEEDDATNV